VVRVRRASGYGDGAERRERWYNCGLKRQTCKRPLDERAKVIGMTRKSLALVFAVWAALTSVAVWWVYLPRTRTFDPVRWNNDDSIAEGLRPGMADDLIERSLLKGKSRPEVVSLLGQGWSDPDDRSLFYRLRDLLPIDSEWLVVGFDEADRVAVCRIIQR
jgi:hypothetical protein